MLLLSVAPAIAIEECSQSKLTALLFYLCTMNLIHCYKLMILQTSIYTQPGLWFNETFYVHSPVAVEDVWFGREGLKHGGTYS